MMPDIYVDGAREQSGPILDSIRCGRTLFVLVLSYTRTAEIPGITIAGADPESLKYTPPADAEFIQYGRCICIPGIPVTPDGKPSPSLLTRTALEFSEIPHMVVDAGGIVRPQLPHIHTCLEPGNNIEHAPAMTIPQARRAIEHGRSLGHTLSKLCDCLVIGECVPGGTTTALATMRGLNLPARVSSSMPDSPDSIKDRVVRSALGRLGMDDYQTVVAQTSDPMILFASAMASAASGSTNIMLAGGTQMLAVLAVSTKMGLEHSRVAIGTTTYISKDESIGFPLQSSAIAPIPVISVDPLLDRSSHAGLQSYARGFAKEGAGAGGALIAALARTDTEPSDMLPLIDREYSRVLGV